MTGTTNRYLPGSGASIVALLVAALPFEAAAQTDRDAGGDEAPAVEGSRDASEVRDERHPAPSKSQKNRPERPYSGYGPHPGPRWEPRPPPRTPEEARDPLVAKAMRDAPLPPDRPERYRGGSDTMKAARSLAERIPAFFNYRATIARGRWQVNPYVAWRIRPAEECLADLRARGIRYSVYRADPPEDPDDDPPPPFPTPTPVHVIGPVEGVRFTSGRDGRLLVSCELAARLPAFAAVLARHDVDQLLVASGYRTQPRSSFHTFGMALDIARVHLRQPARGPDGRPSEWAVVLNDFLETPDHDTCDPALLGPDSPLGDNERGRLLLSIACELFESGDFSSVLTPNYNPGHRDHFHVDVRPDDPRTFIR